MKTLVLGLALLALTGCNSNAHSTTHNSSTNSNTTGFKPLSSTNLRP